MSVDQVLTRTTGAPSHAANPGSLSVDVATGTLYVRTSGGSWSALGGASPQDIALDPFQGGSVVPIDNGGENNNHADGMIGDGDITVTGGAGSTGLQRDASGPYVLMSPGSNAGEQAWFSNDGLLWQARWEPACLIKFQFGNDDRSRLWLGFANNSAATMNSDNPAGSHAALRFANADNTFRFVTKGGGVQSDIDSGVTPVNGTVYYLKIEAQSGQVDYTLYDSTFSEIASHSETTNVPADTDDLRWHLYTENESVNAARDLGIYFGQVQNRNI